uniref:Cell division protein FtsB n=1 Tax=Candidatus Aschnera chinzeii TaxID=1485666 RepID=A0AAT9G541_9ENTR|nr:MAG: cell division protein FtsB [Candidatus Aschnera chinzeii]
MNKLTIILLFILVWLQYSLWFTKSGLLNYINTKNEIFIIYKKNINLKEKNKLLYFEINDLCMGYEAIEEQARTELNMIKPNESYYRIINE